MVDQRCRECEGKVKIEGYMSVSDEEAHHQYRQFIEYSVQSRQTCTESPLNIQSGLGRPVQTVQ